MPHILVLGANGQLGTEIKNICSNNQSFQWSFADIEELDLSQSESIEHYFQTQFDWVINCAAYTAVDRAEEEAELAFRLNEGAVADILKACSTHTKLLHVSTDYVFDGAHFTPYTEEDEPRPQGVYGKSKRAGEEAILNSDTHAIIVRTSWLYGVYGHNFVKTMLRLGRDKQTVRVVFDQIGTPTYAYDLAIAIIHMVQQDLNGEKIHLGREIFHYSNEGVCSWYDFAQEIFDVVKIKNTVVPIESKDYPTPTPRPFYSVLNKEKIKQRYGLSIPHWKKSLHQALFLLYPVR